ncbi:MAG: CPBP family intramembrane metalloprotease [Clostridiales bacterium]|nr:CPBP family intramembrane metalloprotease [Clostridiales bacterium]
MEEKLRRFLLVLWRMLAPLLAYEMVRELVYAGARVWFGEPGEGSVLFLTALAAAIASLPLGLVYHGQSRNLRPAGNGSRKTDRAGFAACQKMRKRSPVILPVVIAGCSACLCLNHLMMLLPMADMGWQEVSGELYLPPVSAQILCTGLVIPLVEELIFRGFAFCGLRSELPFAGAAFVSAVYFGLFHGSLYQGSYAFLVGLLLAAVYELRQSILAAWAFHASANLTAILLTFGGIGARLTERPFWMAVTAALSGAVMMISFCRMRGRKT